MNILITAAGGGGTNGLVDSLGDHSYHFVGTNANFHKAAASNIAPTYLIATAREEKKYVAAINQLIERHDIDLLVPNSDIEVEIVAKYRAEIRTRVFLPNYEVCQIANDKFLCYEHCIAHDIYMAKAVSCNSIEDLEQQLTQFSNYPLWCRVKKGSGSKHTAALHSAAEVVQFVSEKLAKHTDLSVSDFMVSDYLPGDDCLIFTIWHHGTLQYLAMAHRQQYFGEQGRSAPTLIKKEYRQELADFAIRIAQSFEVPPHGVYNFDVKYDQKGKAALTEINIGRFYYNMPLFNASKDGSPLHIYVNAASGRLRETALLSKDELYFLRDQDNAPVVLTPTVMQQKVLTV
ncbi:MAG: hypothetical protein AAF847_18275 [Bacteroidota bacterium]